MRRFLWTTTLALIAGVGMGLAYAWLIAPLPVTDAEPHALRSDFKDQYRSLVAASYAATGSLPRARIRLAILGDANSVEALNAQAQRMLASPQTFERADRIAALARALERDLQGLGPGPAPVPAANMEATGAQSGSTPSSLPHDANLPTATAQPSSSPQLPTPLTVSDPTLSRTPAPESARPFQVSTPESLCDSNLPEGLLQVLVLGRNRVGLAGMEIIVTWDSGRESIFTGLKPELGSGYADYVLAADSTYTVQLARGGKSAAGITVPACQRPDGTAFGGGIRLTFQQP